MICAMSDEERSWLGNFGCNPLEFFAQYQVKLSPMYGPWLNEEIGKVEKRLEEVKAQGKDFAKDQADLDGLAGVQQLAGDATMLFYMSEEGQEGRNAYQQRRQPDFSPFPRRP